MKQLNWILFPVLILQSWAISPTEGKYFNTTCEIHSDCGLDTHLQCVDHYCQCSPNSQIYDKTTKTCRLLAGQQCKIRNHDYQYNRQHSVPIKCVIHAECTKSLCTCNPGYALTPDFLCKPDFGSPCQDGDECDWTLGLSCSNGGICNCFNSTLTYQGEFGCIDPNSFDEMLRMLNQTEHLLQENDFELSDVFYDEGNETALESEDILQDIFAEERQLQVDTYNTNDLQYDAQNDAPEQSTESRFNLRILLQRLRNLIPRNMNGGFLRNLFRGRNRNQGGYAESSSSTPAPSYGPPGGQSEGMGQRMGFLSGLRKRFQRFMMTLRMRLMTQRMRFRNFLSRFRGSTTTAAPPAAQAGVYAGPVPLQENNENAGNQGSGGGGGGGGFLMRARQRFRNLLRGNRGGYPSSPGSSYGPPAGAPAGAGAQPTSLAGFYSEASSDAPVATTESANWFQQNAYVDNHRLASTTRYRSHFSEQETGQQYNTINAGGHPVISHVHQRAPNLQDLGNSHPNSATHDSDNRPNYQSFSGQQPQQQQQEFHQNNDYAPSNAETTSHHQPIFAAQHQNPVNSLPNSNIQPTTSAAQHQQFPDSQINFSLQPTSAAQHQQSPDIINIQPTITAQQHQQLPDSPSPNQLPPPQVPLPITDNNGNFLSSNILPAPEPSTVVDVPPPPLIPQFKLQLQIPQSPEAQPSTQEHLSQNFILSEADDPHPGFTPFPIPTPLIPTQPQLESFRHEPRFERVGQYEQPHFYYRPTGESHIARKWREKF